MFNRVKMLVLFAVILMIGGCSTWSKLDRTEKGAVIGGGTGAAAGSIISPGIGGTAIGGAAGALGGGLIGREMDRDKDEDD